MEDGLLVPYSKEVFEMPIRSALLYGATTFLPAPKTVSAALLLVNVEKLVKGKLINSQFKRLLLLFVGKTSIDMKHISPNLYALLLRPTPCSLIMHKVGNLQNTQGNTTFVAYTSHYCKHEESAELRSKLVGCLDVRLVSLRVVLLTAWCGS